MAYYYRRNINNQRSSWSHNYDDSNQSYPYYYQRQLRNKKNEETLIIDGNTVYEIDHECIKKLRKNPILNENKPYKNI